MRSKACDVMPVEGKPWTADAPLPGGDIKDADFAAFLWQASETYPWLPPEMLMRLGRAYGTRLAKLLGEAASLADLGEHFGGTLYAAELRYLIDHEHARSAHDVLWRQQAGPAPARGRATGGGRMVRGAEVNRRYGTSAFHKA